MNADSYSSARDSSGWIRNAAPWSVRVLLLISAAGALTCCAGDVAMNDPRSGTTEICRQNLLGLNPWSDTMACVAGHEAEGWTRVGQK